MHSVLLIGDSIRLHYQPVVREELQSEAEVIGPAENCETSRKVRARFAVWLESYKPDVIHLNCGLHDIRINRGSYEVQVPLAEYIENVDAIIRLAQRRAPVVIWATTTRLMKRFIARINRRRVARQTWRRTTKQRLRSR